MGSAWSKSNSIEFDNNGERAGGARARFFIGGTTTPLTTYTDAAETTPHTHPVVADAGGRWPIVFIPFLSSYDVRVTTSGGTQLYYPQEIPNPDPVEASEDSVDAEALIATGDVIWSPKAGTRSGFVRLNGRTIGSAASGATERANADTSDLFTFLWDALADTQAPVSTGRGASAAADFAANKTLTLLDAKSSGLIGLDDMGGSAASRLGSATFVNGAATTAGSVAGGSGTGANTQVILEANLAAHTHTFSATSSSDGGHTHTVDITDPGHIHTGTVTAHAGSGQASGAGNFLNAPDGSRALSINSNTTGITAATVSNGAHTHTASGTTGVTGSATALNTLSRNILGTWFQKL